MKNLKIFAEVKKICTIFLRKGPPNMYGLTLLDICMADSTGYLYGLTLLDICMVRLYWISVWSDSTGYLYGLTLLDICMV